MFRRLHHVVSAFLLLPAGALAAGTFVQSPAYKECTALASSDPALALQKADAWLKIDTGIAALHCRAMALYGLRRFAESGEALANVRLAIAKEDILLRSYVARQASRAWLNANQPDKAVNAVSEQINDMAIVSGDNATEARLTAELLLDRAKLRSNYGQLNEAVQDLDHAVSLAPINEDVLIERARVFEQLGDIALARQDLQAVLRGNPTHPLALERMQQLREPVKK